MNILYHHRTQGKGVEKVHIMGIVEAWQKQGHHVDILSPPGVSLTDSGEPGGKAENSKGTWKYLLQHMPEVMFELLEFFYNAWAYFSISRKIRSQSYDLVFERYSLLCFAGLMASKRNGVPFFLEVNYTSHTPIFRKRSRFIKRIERFIEDSMFKRVDGFVVVSSYLKAQLLSMGIPEDKLIVLPNAANPRKFNPEINSEILRERLGLHGEKIVGFTGYFYPWHGVEFFVNAYSGISKFVEDVIFVLVGNGPLYNEISESVKKRNLTDRVLLVGRISHRDIPEYVSLFDVAVMPHSNDYGSPMKILEYMAMGKAVIAPRLGPLEDIIKDGINGLLFEPKDNEDFQKKLVQVLSDERFQKSLGFAARQAIIDKFNWDSNASKIIAFYEKFSKGSRS